LSRIHVLEEPWAEITLADDQHRAALAKQIQDLRIDVLIIGPVSWSGMNEAGTLQEVREFMALVRDLRHRADRPVAIILIHHENRAGRVSGAWEGAVDTLLHVQGQGHGRTRLYVQKARHSSPHHGKAFHLTWAAGDGFEVDEAERDDDTIADEILAYVLKAGGTAWNKVEENVSGKGGRLRAIRDKLLDGERLVNSGTMKSMKLWHADDPACPTRDTVGTQPVSGTAEEGERSPRPVSLPKRDTDGTDAPFPPDELFKDVA
jgi:hypothetical protein